MAVTVWGSASSWTLTALPLFIWMGEILFRTKLSESMFRGLAPWVSKLPGRLLHTNVVGCTIFAAVSGSSAATCATIGKMTLPELKKRGYPEDITIGSLAGAGTLGLLALPDVPLLFATALCLDAGLRSLRRVDAAAAAELAIGLAIGGLTHYRFAAVIAVLPEGS